MNKTARIIVSTASILLGILLFWPGIVIIWDCLTVPYAIRMLWIPLSRIIIRVIFGILLTTGGTLLLSQNKFYKLFYNLIAFCLFSYGFDNLLIGDYLSGYTLFKLHWFRLFSILFWIAGLIIYFFNNRTNRLSKSKICILILIGFILTFMIDIIYFSLNPHWFE